MAVEVVKKYLDRRDWTRITGKKFSWTGLDLPSFRGVAGLVTITGITSPAVFRNLGVDLTVADDGYSWLCLGPEGGHWWLTAMFDERGNLFQHYFDITRRNGMEGAASWFEDMMLDVVMFPDGEIGLLDREELDAALAAGNITPEEHRLALETGEELLASAPGRAEELNEFCRCLRKKLLEKQQNEEEKV